MHLESVQRRKRFWLEQLPLHGRLALQAYVTLAISEIVAQQPVAAPGSESASGTYSSAAEVDTAHAIERMLDEQVYTDVTITELAERQGLSRTQFTKIFTKVYGISPRQYISRQKMNTDVDEYGRVDRRNCRSSRICESQSFLPSVSPLVRSAAQLLPAQIQAGQAGT
nr:AraC family transcriptional regulator [Paenibacillus oceani]